MSSDRRIAYFSMEIGLETAIPTYSGGLGVLAGDTVRSAADLGVPMAAITLVHRKGYFFQRLDESGWQREEPALWVLEDFLEELPGRVQVDIEGRVVQIRAWKKDIVGVTGHVVPIYLLDTDLPENSDWDRTVTHYLYGGDAHYRICQEVVLGIGGLRMLRAVGHDSIERFHMNEGHAAFLALELLDERLKAENHVEASAADIESVHKRCVFTTHTPVPAGHDKFPMDMVRHVLGDKRALANPRLFESDGALNMTYLALNLSRFVNGVAKRHAEVATQMFSGRRVEAVTNGVHAVTWTSPSFQELFDKHLPGWRADSLSLRAAESIPRSDVLTAHRRTKEYLIHHVNRETNAGFDVDIFTIGFARRVATYKRHTLLFQDIEWLRQIAKTVGAFQIVFAGKAHPHDQPGKELLQQIYQAKNALRDHVRITYLENYDMEVGKLLTSGADLWLNTPRPPLEASGTSGMKAALNGVPSLSILDGWWVEGWIENITGWAIGEDEHGMAQAPDDTRDATSLYRKLENVILPMYYHDRNAYIDIMRHCISINGSFFNTQRMMHEYVLKAYFR
ncbi:MAG: alpha-glucan family phosphorylase [Planctomycetes bacterium]|nr:alpha-glucan family phosphorylase [Planctomycetota bacterium]MBI3834631.1 alpha-glucan family phosphorylase [Planctomycetota bacterium]